MLTVMEATNRQYGTVCVYIPEHNIYAMVMRFAGENDKKGRDVDSYQHHQKQTKC